MIASYFVIFGGSLVLLFPVRTNGQECYGINSGIDYSPGEHDITDYSETDLGQCCSECQQEPRCQTYVWSKSLNHCWLKDVTGPSIPNPDRISGFKWNVCAVQPKDQCRKITSGIDYSPGSHDIASKENIELAACCTFCRSNSKCRAFVWSKSSKHCWLKGVNSPRAHDADRISGLVN